ncbi:ribosomal protein L34e-domain-containing protein [Dissophora ornata]|nr:ribosomal protein L34e-domain-containing protein [Dissophora ornata]
MHTLKREQPRAVVVYLSKDIHSQCWIFLYPKKMAQRLTYRRRLSYNTKSNRTRVVKTPGGRLTWLYEKKPGTAPKCGDCGVALPGVSFG